MCCTNFCLNYEYDRTHFQVCTFACENFIYCAFIVHVRTFRDCHFQTFVRRVASMHQRHSAGCFSFNNKWKTQRNNRRVSVQERLTGVRLNCLSLSLAPQRTEKPKNSHHVWPITKLVSCKKCLLPTGKNITIPCLTFCHHHFEELCPNFRWLIPQLPLPWFALLYSLDFHIFYTDGNSPNPGFPHSSLLFWSTKFENNHGLRCFG